MYTALLGFPDELKRGLRIISLPEAQETADVPCDTGIDLDALNKEFDGVPVDLSLVHEGWNSKTGKWAPDSQAIVARAKEVRQWLKARPEKEVVLVTHGGFVHFLTEDWDDYNKLAGTGWLNTEFRSYEFVSEAGDNASIVETKESRKARVGKEVPLTETEQLAVARTKSSESNGIVPSKV
ncbi:MAG: hypothetical protein MMC23_007068 [Stictis urceolatum]|nr:hypothetical protein [Stictis urceolata]